MSTDKKLAIEYFNIGGRAEVPRAALWIANIPFDDIRLSQAEFKANQEAGKYPLGQLPVLHVGDQVIPQSLAHIRYTGRLAGLYPSDAEAALAVDAVIYSVEDVITAVVSTFHCDEEQRKTKRTEICEKTLPRLFKYVSALREKNAGSKFIVGDSLTVADLCLFITVNNWVGGGFLDHIPPSVITSDEKFSAYINGLKDLDVIKGYLEKSAAAIQKGTYDIAARENAASK